MRAGGRADGRTDVRTNTRFTQFPTYQRITVLPSSGWSGLLELLYPEGDGTKIFVNGKA
jgi:hypothetical protein